MVSRKIIIFAFAIIAIAVGSVFADLDNWQGQAQITTGNVVADNTGWTFNGTAGISFDYGDLDEDDNSGTLGAGASIEYIFNLADSGTSISLGAVNGWGNSEMTGFKLEQWSDTGVFGDGIEGWYDYTFPGATSVFDTDVHVVFVNRATDGEYELFVNGVSKGIDSRGGVDWVNNGGVGSLGSTSSLTADVAVGTIYAVGSYDRELSPTEISGLYDAYTSPAGGATNPNPENKDTDIVPSVILSWTTGDDPNNPGNPNPKISHHQVYMSNGDPADEPNVYLVDTLVVGTTEYDPLANGQPDPTHTGNLTRSQDYFWRIDEVETYPVDDPNIITGALWKFTVVGADPEADPVTPELQYVNPNNTVVLHVTARHPIHGDETDLSFQWYKGVPGDTSTTVGIDDPNLTLTNVGDNEDGEYYCRVTVTGAGGGGFADSESGRVVVKGLKGHWELNENLEDATAYNHNGTYTDPNDLSPSIAGTEVYVDGVEGKALKCDPNVFHVRIAEPNDFFNFYPQGVTASCWIKCQAEDSYQIAFAKASLHTSGWGVGRYNQTGFVNFRADGLYPDLFGGAITLNEWHNVVEVFDAIEKRVKLYVDGEFKAQSGLVTGNIPITNSSVVIGAETPQGDSPFDGYVDDARIWNYPLDPITIAYLYTDLSGGTACIDYQTGLQFDYNGDCVVNLLDYATFATDWLNCNIVPDCVPRP